ncbi:MAG: tRNA (N(6)-L-threonylcarbamoyladenosine(37)-C(2))-methylthiotransferase MtaB, partial [Candidatus Omnitrophica bacterium]|nr:tRNA (N(6)-L-threonylcarbamoyladenosine(37)-C(2))-methylthiotransferase MtaB [Candidatus Omnitrophota bacterium]
MRTIRFYTLGCKVNQYDTQKIREQFQNAGFRELDKGRPADVYVVNTCTVTGRADSDSLNYVRRAKRENPNALLVVTGCLAELDSKKIKQIKGV